MRDTLSVQDEKGRVDGGRLARAVLREALLDKDAVTHVLSRLAVEYGNSGYSKRAGFYYLISSVLRDIELEYDDKPTNVMSTDGKKIYVGPLYLKVKEVYGSKVVPALFAHEVMHIVHGHYPRMKLVRNPKLYNIVADLYINEILAKYGLKLDEDFVTFTSFIKFLEESSIRVKPEHREKLLELAKQVVREEITVERLLSIIEHMEDVSGALNNRFKKSVFFGSDLPNKQEASKNERTQNNKQVGKHTVAQNKDRGVLYVGDTDDTLNEWKRRVEEAREQVKDIMERIHKVMGEMSAVRRGGGFGVGLEEVFDTAEIRELKKLAVDIERELEAVLSRAVEDYYYTYSRFSEEAYWLPYEEEEAKPKVHVLLDVSGSIPERTLFLFLSWIHSATTKYGIKAHVYPFAVDIKDKFEITSTRIPKRVVVGGGTVWDNKTANLFKELSKEAGKNLVVVLSDFYISINPKTSRAIDEFRYKGGIISCVTSTKLAPNWCTFVHFLPDGLSVG